jgi:hypothetical protein
MKGLRFNTTGAPIQVGSMTGASTGTGVAVSGVIEIAEVTGAGVYVLFGTSSGMSAPASDGSIAGSFFIPPYGVTRPIVVPDSQTYVKSSGTNINVRNLAAG